MRNRVTTIYAILSDTYIVYISTHDCAHMVPGVNNVYIKYLVPAYNITQPKSQFVTWPINKSRCGFGNARWQTNIIAAQGIYIYSQHYE